MSGVLRAIRMLELQRENREMSSRILSARTAPPGGLCRHRHRRPHHAGDLLAISRRSPSSRQPLLITGESGVGKELIARAVHGLSGCRGPLVAVNVAGLDDTVFADTLFGHVRGAFTGAEQAAARHGRGGRRRDPVPGRDRRPEHRLPGEAAAAASGGGVLPAGQRPAQAAEGAHHRGHPPAIWPPKRQPAPSGATSTTGCAPTRCMSRR